MKIIKNTLANNKNGMGLLAQVYAMSRHNQHKHGYREIPFVVILCHGGGITYPFGTTHDETIARYSRKARKNQKKDKSTSRGAREEIPSIS